MTDTDVQRKEQSCLLKDGSLPTEDFYRLHKGEKPVPFLIIMQKISFCRRELVNFEELEFLEEALMFSPQGVSLAWIEPDPSQEIIISHCPDKTIHVCSRKSPWAIPVSVFRTEVFQKLRKIYPYCDSTDLFCRMTVQPVSKGNGISFAKVGI